MSEDRQEKLLDDIEKIAPKLEELIGDEIATCAHRASRGFRIQEAQMYTALMNSITALVASGKLMLGDKFKS